MSSTRRVQAGESRRQNGWASAAEYDVLRGLNGTAVAFKAALQDAPKKRELLYSLQALSLREGGVKRIARELLEMFPERIGSPTMHKIGCKPGKKLSGQESGDIRDELDPDTAIDRALSVFRTAFSGESEPESRRTYSADYFISECRYLAANSLPGFIEDLCCNPKMEVARQSESRKEYHNAIDIVMEDAREILS